MKTRLLTLLLATVAIPALAQPTNVKYASTKATTAPAQPMINFANQKITIDSLVSIADEGGNVLVEHASFRGKAREGKYWVECFFTKSNKEVLKANFLFTTDSLNYSRCYYFKNNSVVKIQDNQTANYYQVGNVVLSEQGTAAPQPVTKKFNDLITDTFQSLLAGLFP